MLPPLSVVFALLVAFLASQAWSDADRASTAVNREASALRGVVLLAAEFPGQPEASLRELIALVHSDNRAANRIIMTMFATGVGVAVVLLASHSRPFTGEISVRPAVLLQVRPEAGTSARS
jgi:hypothetical protein